MRERPILFSAAMVRAILDGRKTMTRRIVKPFMHREGTVSVEVQDGAMRARLMHPWGTGLVAMADCPYGAPGDRLWVRETWDFRPWGNPDQNRVRIVYAADGAQMEFEAPPDWNPTIYGSDRWRPSIFMPRWASRIQFTNEAVRIERLHDITEEDARAEGVYWGARWSDSFSGVAARERFGSDIDRNVAAFALAWEKINGVESWNANPWVWCVGFKPAPTDPSK